MILLQRRCKEFISSCDAKFVLLGIPEDIGIHYKSRRQVHFLLGIALLKHYKFSIIVLIKKRNTFIRKISVSEQMQAVEFFAI
jgi:hypothetical protein